MLRATTACTFSTSELQKVVRDHQFFSTFDFEICFAPQRRALFRHLNFQKWSDAGGVLYIFDFHMCFAPQRRALFSTSQLPKVVREWCVFAHFDLEMCFAPQTACNFSSLIWPAGSAPAALASLLFDPPEPQIIGKNTVFSRLSYLFAHLHLLSSDLVSSDFFSPLLFNCPYCRKFHF